MKIWIVTKAKLDYDDYTQGDKTLVIAYDGYTRAFEKMESLNKARDKYERDMNITYDLTSVELEQ